MIQPYFRHASVHGARGISPRGALAVSRISRAAAFLEGRDYVIPEDVQSVFLDVCAHRILLSQRARTERVTERDVLNGLLQDVAIPFSR